MTIPVQVTFHGIDHSDAVEQLVRERAAKLQTFHSDLTGCRVSLEAPHRHRQHGNNYRVRIDLRVPGGDEIVFSRNPDKGRSHADLYAAINDAFDGAGRSLHDFVERRRTNGRRPRDA